MLYKKYAWFCMTRQVKCNWIVSYVWSIGCNFNWFFLRKLLNKYMINFEYGILHVLFLFLHNCSYTWNSSGKLYFYSLNCWHFKVSYWNSRHIFRNFITSKIELEFSTIIIYKKIFLNLIIWPRRHLALQFHFFLPLFISYFRHIISPIMFRILVSNWHS